MDPNRSNPFHSLEGGVTSYSHFPTVLQQSHCVMSPYHVRADDVSEQLYSASSSTCAGSRAANKNEQLRLRQRLANPIGTKQT